MLWDYGAPPKGDNRWRQTASLQPLTKAGAECRLSTVACKHLIMIEAAPEPFLQAIDPYREGLVVAVECLFTWYWLADLWAQEGIAFVLGHALYMKAIHGGKANDDTIDSHRGLLPNPPCCFCVTTQRAR